jgi:hypothetical protein
MKRVSMKEESKIDPLCHVISLIFSVLGTILAITFTNEDYCEVF